MTPVRQTIETGRLSANRVLALVLLSTALLLVDSQAVSLAVADESQPTEYSPGVTLERYTGIYEGPNALIVVTRNGNQLFVQWSGEIKVDQVLMQLSGQVKIPISPTRTGEYLLPRSSPKIAFATDDKGQASELVLHVKAGEDLHAKRTADLPSSRQIGASLDKAF